MTIRDALNHGVHELSKAHTHDPAGCARFLLRHALAENPDNLVLTRPDTDLSAEQRERFLSFLERRRLHEPVWYITHEAFFWKDSFYVDERVLIPRPETELLVERVLEHVKDNPARKISIIDVGTGSGEIAISLYKEIKGRGVLDRFYASDLSPEAVEVAKLNAKRLGAKDVHFLVGDALDPLNESVDLIVGNPPYIPSETIGGLAYDIHHFEPRVALDGGKDGLDIHRKILRDAPKRLKKHGAIFLEIGHDQGKLARSIAAKHFLAAKIEIIKDYNGNDRILSVKT